LPLNPSNRDLVLIGASAGGLAPLRRIFETLPDTFPASVIVVHHVGSSSILPQILDCAGALPVAHAENGQVIERSRVYVAPPGYHTLLHDDHILLSRGPRENFCRPSVDVLFRSAAANFGARVIGLVLSGALSDGTAGLRAIKRCGGLAVAQDPQDAAVPGMPASAVRHVDLDHCVEAAKLGELLVALAALPAGETPAVPLDIRLETFIAAQDIADMNTSEELGSLSRFTCPECRGPLWEIPDGCLLRYRCRVGHAFNADSVLAGQAAEVERLLWSFLRTNMERADLAWRVAGQERKADREDSAMQIERRAREYETNVTLARQLLHKQEDEPIEPLHAAG
jgi:two-component system, chemotaxis family, protein-glutamate methylesterase/glutaminase